MFHNQGDGNGASSAFFWMPADRSQSVAERQASSLTQELNNHYSIFAYAIEGNDVLEALNESDILKEVTVEDGPWRLVSDDSALDEIMFDQEGFD